MCFLREAFDEFVNYFSSIVLHCVAHWVVLVFIPDIISKKTIVHFKSIENRFVYSNVVVIKDMVKERRSFLEAMKNQHIKKFIEAKIRSE